MKIAIIGAGNLGVAIGRGLVINNSYTSLYLTKKNTSTISDWIEYGKVVVTSDNREAVKNSDILLFTVQPRHIDEVLEEVKDLLTDKHVIISTVTGVNIERIESIIGSDNYIIRAMPNTAISVGKSMTCICSNEKGKKRVVLAQAIFNKLGNSLEISEEQMQAATVICASGIAFWMRLIRTTTQGAIQLGFDSEVAQELSVHTCMGAATLLLKSGNHPEKEIDRVTTPGGCTIEGLNQMEQEGMSTALIKGILASFDKINHI